MAQLLSVSFSALPGMLTHQLLLTIILLAVLSPTCAKPLKVFILAGQSNMVGPGSIKHLDLLVNSHNCSCNPYRKALWNGTGYKEKENVYMKFNENHGKLTVGPRSGFAPDNSFGPELMFGWVVGDAFPNETILLIKAAWGGKSLCVDFRPPRSGEGNFSDTKPIQYGVYYRLMVEEVLDTLSSLEKYVPGYDKSDGYDLAGFVWFQGWNDVINWQCITEYGQNLANFIRDMRLDFGPNATQLPVIVGELGQAGMNPDFRHSDHHIAMRAAEHGVTVLPEFKNNSLFVRTAPYVISNGTQYGGDYHYYGRADTFFHIGEAFGKGMLQLMGSHVSSATGPACKMDCVSGSSHGIRGSFPRSHW